MNKGKVRDNAQLAYKKELVKRIIWLKGWTSTEERLQALMRKRAGDLKKMLEGI